MAADDFLNEWRGSFPEPPGAGPPGAEPPGGEPPGSPEHPDSTSRAFAAWFGATLHDHLGGRLSEADRAAFPDRVAVYRDWADTHPKNLNRQDPGPRDAALRDPTFHRLTRLMLPVWLRVIAGEQEQEQKPEQEQKREPEQEQKRKQEQEQEQEQKQKQKPERAPAPESPPAPSAARLLQSRLAFDSVVDQELIDGAALRDGEPDARVASARRVGDDFLGQADMLIVLLELMASHRSLAVLPAPPQFRSTVPGREVDFIVLDLAHQRVTGVRAVDARGVGPRRADPRSSGSQGADMPAADASIAGLPWPGLLAAHVAWAVHPGSPEALAIDEELFELLRPIAGRLRYGTASNLVRATSVVAERVMRQLSGP